MMEPSGAGPPNDDHRIARPASWTLHSRRRALREQDFQTIGVHSHAEIALAVRDPRPRCGCRVSQPADDVKPPPAGYRHWFHVNTMIIDKASPLFKDLGGMHNVYVNSVGEAALKKGGPYPDKSMFVTDLHDFTVSDGSYVEGARKGLAVMMKDSKKYASTGGWGFQFWEGGDPKKPQVTDAAKQCFACHQPKKDQDYVYSTYIP
jgi:hypothetical protein